MHRPSAFVKCSIVFAVLALFVQTWAATPVSAQRLSKGSSCPVVTGQPYRSPKISTVYYVTSACQKRPIFNPAVYFSHFTSWSNVVFLEQKEIDAIPNDPLNFLPWGPLRNFENNSLVKVTSDPKVYVLEDGKAYPIASEEAFKSIGFEFNQIEDLWETAMAKYPKQRAVVSGPDTVPPSFVFKYSDAPEVYLIQSENGVLAKWHIPNMETLRSFARPDRIGVFQRSVNFSNSAHGGGGGGSSSGPSGPSGPSVPSNPSVPSGSTGSGESGGTKGESGGSTADGTAPVVTTFSVSSTSDSLLIPIKSFTATDNISVTGYFIGETNVVPSTQDPGWKASVPESYMTSSQGQKTLYAFARDAAGNISTPKTASVNVEDTLPPIVSGVASSTTPTSITVSWMTNEVSTSTLQYGSNIAYSNSMLLNVFESAHTATISGLNPETFYYFRIISQDLAGNLMVTTNYTVRTAPEP